MSTAVSKQTTYLVHEWDDPAIVATVKQQITERVPRYLRDDPNRIWPDERELKPLVAVARWAAWRVPVKGYESHELQWEALLRIVLDYKKIAASVTPNALARHIAIQHLLDVWRRENRRAASYQSASQM